MAQVTNKIVRHEANTAHDVLLLLRFIVLETPHTVFTENRLTLSMINRFILREGARTSLLPLANAPPPWTMLSG